MVRKKLVVILIMVLLAAAAVGAVAGIRYSFRAEKTNYTKKVIFSFDFSTSFISAELGPGDTVTIRPYVISESSVPVYVFIKVDMPYVSGGPLYDINVSNDWKAVEENAGTLVYAYAESEMTVLDPGEYTTYLASTMTMKSLSVADFAGIDDINATFTAYTMEVTDDIPTDPAQAWNTLKELIESH